MRLGDEEWREYSREDYIQRMMDYDIDAPETNPLFEGGSECPICSNKFRQKDGETVIFRQGDCTEILAHRTCLNHRFSARYGATHSRRRLDDFYDDVEHLGFSVEYEKAERLYEEGY